MSDHGAWTDSKPANGSGLGPHGLKHGLKISAKRGRFRPTTTRGITESHHSSELNEVHHNRHRVLQHSGVTWIQPKPIEEERHVLAYRVAVGVSLCLHSSHQGAERREIHGDALSTKEGCLQGCGSTPDIWIQHDGPWAYVHRVEEGTHHLWMEFASVRIDPVRQILVYGSRPIELTALVFRPNQLAIDRLSTVECSDVCGPINHGLRSAIHFGCEVPWIIGIPRYAVTAQGLKLHSRQVFLIEELDVALKTDFIHGTLVGYSSISPSVSAARIRQETSVTSRLSSSPA